MNIGQSYKYKSYGATPTCKICGCKINNLDRVARLYPPVAADNKPPVIVEVHKACVDSHRIAIINQVITPEIRVIITEGDDLNDSTILAYVIDIRSEGIPANLKSFYKKLTELDF
jgi:hypothetical protein